MAKKPSDAIQRANAAILERITGVSAVDPKPTQTKAVCADTDEHGTGGLERLREANSRLFSAKMGTPEADVGHIFLGPLMNALIASSRLLSMMIRRR